MYGPLQGRRGCRIAMVRRMSPTLDLLKRASWRAEVLFKQRGSFRTIVWLTEDAGGHRAQFETACSAPVGISNDEVLSALGREMAADFRRDAVGVVRFAVAYPARIVTISTMLGGERLRRQVQIVAVEAHDDCGAHLRGTREIIHRGRAPAMLAALGKIERADNSLYAGLLTTCVPA